MKYRFNGLGNWQPTTGELTMTKGFDVFRASASTAIPRDVCESCVCWREYGTCSLVQVEDFVADRIEKANQLNVYPDADCVAWRNCCPVMFFDFVGIKLPELEVLK